MLVRTCQAVLRVHIALDSSASEPCTRQRVRVAVLAAVVIIPAAIATAGTAGTATIACAAAVSIACAIATVVAIVVAIVVAVAGGVVAGDHTTEEIK